MTDALMVIDPRRDTLERDTLPLVVHPAVGGGVAVALGVAVGVLVRVGIEVGMLVRVGLAVGKLVEVGVGVALVPPNVIAPAL